MHTYQGLLAGVIWLCVLQGLAIVGLITRYARRARAEQHSAELELRANQASLRELACKLLGAGETERRRIARELHDDLGQGLALLAVELDLLQQKPPEAPKILVACVERLSTRVKQLSSSIHDLSHQLHPMKLEQLGLVAALRSLCMEVGESHDLKIDFVHDELPASLQPDVSLCLYRVAQEALQNVIKHSHAQKAVVELRITVDAMCLRVQDDGIGLSASSAANHDGLGLASMRERVRLVNGDIAFDGSSPHGTQVKARVPRGAENRAELVLQKEMVPA